MRVTFNDASGTDNPDDVHYVPLDIYEYISYVNAGNTVNCIMAAQTAEAGEEMRSKFRSADYERP